MPSSNNIMLLVHSCANLTLTVFPLTCLMCNLKEKRVIESHECSKKLSNITAKFLCIHEIFFIPFNKAIFHKIKMEPHFLDLSDMTWNEEHYGYAAFLEKKKQMDMLLFWKKKRKWICYFSVKAITRGENPVLFA